MGVSEAGCDEAGRGALAGPVYASAVILPPDFFHPLLNDSKQLKESQRDKLRAIIEAEAIDWAVAWATPEEIDKVNILKASILSMHRALENLRVRPQSIIVDGNRFLPYKDIPYNCFVKGDGRYSSIAAASVLAKTHRDEFMKKIDIEFPCYGWAKNMAYPTSGHREAIRINGVSKYHRVSYRLLPEPDLFSFTNCESPQREEGTCCKEY